MKTSPLLLGAFAFFFNVGLSDVQAQIADLQPKEVEPKGHIAENMSKPYRSFAEFSEGSMNKAPYTNAVLRSLKKHAKKASWKKEFSAIKIISNSWHVVRSEKTGKVLYRTLAAYCFAKRSDGLCSVTPIVFKQRHNGTTFISTFILHESDNEEVVVCN